MYEIISNKSEFLFRIWLKLNYSYKTNENHYQYKVKMIVIFFSEIHSKFF